MPRAQIAVIGTGWWSQGWHIPSLHENEACILKAVVDRSPHPKSNLNPDLESLETLKKKYGCHIYNSVEELLQNHGNSLQGIIIATPHATHYELYTRFLDYNAQHRKIEDNKTPICILLERPMTTDVHQTLKLAHTTHHLRLEESLWINHSANYRKPAQVVRQYITKIGNIRHISAFLASSLSWIFEDPQNTGWNEPSAGMRGNGFAWGQSSHVLAWIFHGCPQLSPKEVFCRQNFSSRTGADVSHAASIVCSSAGTNDVIISLSGTSLLPGNEHGDNKVGKQVRVYIYGDKGALVFGGNDAEPSSGCLEYLDADGHRTMLEDSFYFENLEHGLGPESLQTFVDFCNGQTAENCADVDVGLKSVQILEAMYRSQHEQVQVQVVDKAKE